jgi:hypothetical protein
VRPTRLVAPLILPAQRGVESELTPRFVIEGRDVYLDPLTMQAVSTSGIGGQGRIACG